MGVWVRIPPWSQSNIKSYNRLCFFGYFYVFISMEKEKLIEIVKSSTSKSEVCRKMGLDTANGNNRKKINKLLKDYDISHFTYGNAKYDINQLKEAVNSSLNISEVCRKLNLKANGGNFSSLKKKIKANDISTEHFTGKSWNTGDRYINNSVTYELDEVMVENSTYSRYHLKRRLINEGILDYKCNECSLIEWNGKPITLQLDHINGVNDDHRLENLRLLCPNCHSQTKTFAGRNIKRHT